MCFEEGGFSFVSISCGRNFWLGLSLLIKLKTTRTCRFYSHSICFGRRDVDLCSPLCGCVQSMCLSEMVSR